MSLSFSTLQCCQYVTEIPSQGKQEHPHFTESISRLLKTLWVQEPGHKQTSYSDLLSQNHDDVIKGEHFPRYWPFVGGIHRSPGEFPTQRTVTQSFDIFFDLCMNKQLSKQSWGWWPRTPSRPLWRHCNVFQGPHRKGKWSIIWHELQSTVYSFIYIYIYMYT